MNKIYLYLLASVFAYVFSACNDELATITPPTFTTVEFESSTLRIPEEVPLSEIMLLVSNPSKEDVEVTISAIDETAIQGVHFELPQTSITIPKGAFSANIPITVFDDLEVTPSRRFKLNIESISSADTSLMSQQMTVYITNNDKRPTIKFLEANYNVTEKSEGVLVKYMTEGIFPNPVAFRVRFSDNSAKPGVHYDYPAIVSPIDSINEDTHEVYFTADTAKIDSVFIPLNTATDELRDGDKGVRLTLFTANSDFLAGGLRYTEITIEDIKTVSFVESVVIISELEDGSSKVTLPIEFNDVPQGGVTAMINVEGLSSGDYTWVNETITTDKDTIVDAVLSIKSSVAVPAYLVFSITGDASLDIDTRKILAKKTVVLPKTRWAIESATSEHDNNSLAANIKDGDIATYWHSRWGDNLAAPPHIIIIDMNDECLVSSTELWARSVGGSNNATIVKVSFSIDNENWSTPIEMDLSGADATTPSVSKGIEGGVAARYIKVQADQSSASTGAVALAEISVKGIIANRL